MLPFKLVYSDDYYLPIGSHVFPAEKYKCIHDRLLASGIAAPSDFVTPRPATDQDVLLVHTPQYVEKLKAGTLSAREELELEVPYSPELVRAFWLAAGGSMLAADHALKDGLAISIGGGFHHAFPDHGEGFCMIHDVAIAIRRMQRDDKIRTAMTVDCDVHQGNGTAVIFAGTRVPSEPLPSVPTFTMNPPRPAETRMHSARAGDVFTISLLQSLNRQRQSAELIFAIRIGSGEVTDEFRLEHAQSQTERVADARQIFGVADPVGQIQVKRRRGLKHRVVVLLMERDGEDVPGAGAVHSCFSRARWVHREGGH